MHVSLKISLIMVAIILENSIFETTVVASHVMKDIRVTHDEPSLDWFR